jgi:hypothetical protein
MSHTRVVGTKFHPDGSVRQFPGNTIICYCDPASNTYALLDWTQQEIKMQPFADKITLLPMSSMHMTVMQLLCIDHRVAAEWSKNLSLEATVEEADQFFIETVAKVPPPDNFRMAYTGLAVSDVGFGFGLKPADAATHEAIWAFRNAIAEATGVRFPNHNDYKFHISLGYLIVQLTRLIKRRWMRSRGRWMRTWHSTSTYSILASLI